MQQFDLLTDLCLDGALGPARTQSFRLSTCESEIIRTVKLRSGIFTSSSSPLHLSKANHDLDAEFDASWLRNTKSPPHSGERGAMRIIDLFSGCGALSLGIVEACRALNLEVEHVFAADINSLALDVYKRNFKPVLTSVEPIQTLVGKLNSELSSAERTLCASFGKIDILAGGPPCQGHSDLNNYTRRDDPRNALFETMIRFAQIIQPKHVIIENVPGIKRDTRRVTEIGRRALEAMGYTVEEAVLTASDYGAAQRRRRYFMVATINKEFRIDALHRVHKPRTVRWACEDLAGLISASTIDSHAASSPTNRKRIEYLHANDLYDLPNELRPKCHRDKSHSYNAVYGRLSWDEPAPTITSGFNSPGQGRFIHPSDLRTLTPHEAARIQFLPDFFAWGDSNREGLTQMIGNAVPPKLAYAVALEILR